MCMELYQLAIGGISQWSLLTMQPISLNLSTIEIDETQFQSETRKLFATIAVAKRAVTMSFELFVTGISCCELVKGCSQYSSINRATGARRRPFRGTPVRPMKSQVLSETRDDR